MTGPDKARVQIMDRMAERNAVRNGDELWFYNSKDNTAAHAQLPADAAGRHAARPGTVPTPEDLADKLLAKLDASTEVTVGPDVQVAGRAAYNLVLTPDVRGHPGGFGRHRGRRRTADFRSASK